MTNKVRLFVSSPSDVQAEREQVAEVIERIQVDYPELEVSVYRWEETWFSATEGYQEQIAPPDECDLVLLIIWKRLGSELPERFNREDGSARTGTEYEFEVAMSAALSNSVPDILVYRKTAQITFEAEKVEQQRAELHALEGFWRRWLRNEKGHFTGAFKPFETTDEFAQLLGQDFRAWLEDHSGDIRWPESKGSPFRGLERFDEQHSAVFFGRSRAIRELRARLLANINRDDALNFMVVVGASGSGKSSLVRAGLTSLLRKQGHIHDSVNLVPSLLGDNPLQGLAELLFQVLPSLSEGDFDTPDALASTFCSATALGAKPLEGALKRQNVKSERRLLLVIDQLEEVFDWPAEKRAPFIQLLHAFSQSARLLVIGTLRSDFYPSLVNDALLQTLSSDNRQYNLAPIREYELQEVIQAPAKAAGLSFESTSDGRRLDQVILDDAESQSGVLPLLEFTLERLYLERDIDKRMLTFSSYHNMGGLSHAIGEHAESTLTACLSSLSDAELTAVFSSWVQKLLSLGESGEAVRRRTPLTLFDYEALQTSLTQAFIQARLLTVEGDDVATVTFAHEALLHAWPRLSNWLEGNEEFLRWRVRTEREAQQWQHDGFIKGRLLPKGKPLQDAVNYLSARDRDIQGLLRQYVDESIAYYQRRQKRTYGAVGAIITVLLGLTLFAFLQADEALRQQAIAEAAKENAERNEQQAKALRDEALIVESRYLMDLARQQNAQGHHDKAMLLALNALPGKYGGERPLIDDISPLVEAAQKNRLRMVLPHDSNVTDIAVHPDETRLVSASYARITIWDLSSGEVIDTLDIGYAEKVLYSPDGSLLVVINEETLQVFKSDSLEAVNSFKGDALITGVQVLSNNNDIIAAQEDGQLHHWTLDAQPERTISAHIEKINHLALSPDERYVISSSDDRTAVVWQIDKWETVYSFSHDRPVIKTHYFGNDANIISYDNQTIKYWVEGAIKDFGALDSGITQLLPQPSGENIFLSLASGYAVSIALSEDNRLVRTDLFGAPLHSNLLLSDEGFYYFNFDQIYEYSKLNGTSTFQYAITGTPSKTLGLKEPGSLIHVIDKNVYTYTKPPNRVVTSSKYHSLNEDNQYFTHSPSGKYWTSSAINRDVVQFRMFDSGDLWYEFEAIGTHAIKWLNNNDTVWLRSNGKEYFQSTVLDVETKRILFSNESLFELVTEPKLHADNQHLTYVSGFKEVSTVNLANKEISRLKTKGNVIDFVVHDSRYYVATDDGIEVFNQHSQNPPEIWQLRSTPTKLHYLTSKRSFVIQDETDGLLVLDQTGKERFAITDIDGDQDLTFSPDEKYILGFSSEDEYALIDIESGKKVFTFIHQPNQEYTDQTNILKTYQGGVFNDSSTMLVTLSNDNLPILWSVESGLKLYELHHEDIVAGASFRNGVIYTSTESGNTIKWQPNIVQSASNYAKYLPDNRQCLNNDERDKLNVKRLKRIDFERRGCENIALTMPKEELESFYHPIFSAIDENDTESIDVILKAHRSIFALSSEGETVLTLLVKSVKKDLLRKVLESDVDFPLLNSSNETPLTLAIEGDEFEVANLLIKYGIGIDEVDGQGRTPLMHAVMKSNLSLVELLIKENADVNAKTDKGDAVLGISLRHYDEKQPQSIQIINALLSAGVNLNSSVTEKGMHPLIAAIAFNATEAALRLIELGADIHYAIRGHITPLITAIHRKNLVIAKTLIEMGAEIDEDWQKQNYSVFDVLLTEGNISQPNKVVDILNLLFEGGSDVNLISNETGESALHLAIKNGFDSRIIALLVNAGADLKLQNRDGNTPLMEAVIAKNVDAVKMLLEKDDGLLSRNNKQQTVLHLVAAYSLPVSLFTDSLFEGNFIKEAIALRDEDNNSPLHTAISHNNKDFLTTILHLCKGDDSHISDFCNVKNRFGNTPLNMALMSGLPDVALSLLEFGADYKISNNSGWTPLMNAVNKGNVDVVESLLAAGADPNRTTPNGWNSLHLTVDSDNQSTDEDRAQIAKLLLDYGADINAMISSGYTPLGLSVLNRYPATFDVLLSHQPDVDKVRGEAWTPLNNAVYGGLVDFASKLLRAGANPNKTNSAGWSSLHNTVDANNKASDEINAEMAELLLNSGADINALIDAGHSALGLAVLNNRPKTFEVLLSKSPEVDKADGGAWTPLMNAVNSGSLNLTEKLLLAGAKPYLGNADGWSSLHLAINADNTGSDNINAQIVELLLEHGADINQVTNEDRTALMLAVINNRPNTFDVLMRLNAEVDKAGKGNWTPLMEAVNKGLVDFAKDLLANGANPNTVNSDGWSALHLTVNESNSTNEEANLELAQLLLESGANIQALTDSGYTPLGLAVINYRPELFEYLLSNMREVDLASNGAWTPLMNAVNSGQLEFVRKLLNAGADPNKTTSDGWSALHLTLNGENKVEDHISAEMAALLLSHGAEINAFTGNGETAIALAVLKEHTQTLHVLLSHSPEINGAAKDGWTPLMNAVFNGDIYIVDALLEHGADPNKSLPDGWTPLMIASQSLDDTQEVINIRIINMLLEAGAELNDSNDDGFTAFHISVDHQNSLVVQKLLGEGADATIPNKKGEPPLSTATIHGRYPIVAALLSHNILVAEESVRLAERRRNESKEAEAIYQLLLNARESTMVTER